MSEDGEVSSGPEGLAQLGAGVPDQFNRLWTPHRLAYIKGAKDDTCPFCHVPTLADSDGLVVRRGEVCFVVLNLYPYTAGHMMVVPYRHVAGYDELTADEIAEVGGLTADAVRVLRTAAGAQGFNVGMNLGAVAGAGIAGHLHQHVVPRWGGDTNFMPVVGHTRVLPELLGKTRDLLAETWENVSK
jgi:ATP adenylyltransferase